MQQQFYSLPLSFINLLDKKDLTMCVDMKESICQNIHLILITHFGECKQDPTYGCPIWDNDFENIISINLWKENIRKSVKLVLLNHEQRLTNITIRTDISQEEIGSELLKKLKKRVDVIVEGNITETNELFHFKDSLYISPLSFD